MSKNDVHNITPGLASCDQGVRTCVCHPPDLPAGLSVLHCRKYVKLFNFGGTLLISCSDIVLPNATVLDHIYVVRPSYSFCPSIVFARLSNSIFSCPVACALDFTFQFDWWLDRDAFCIYLYARLIY